MKILIAGIILLICLAVLMVYSIVCSDTYLDKKDNDEAQEEFIKKNKYFKF